MMRLVLAFYNKSIACLENGGDIEKIVAMPVREDIGRFKYVNEAEITGAYDEVIAALDAQLDEAKKGEDD